MTQTIRKIFLFLCFAAILLAACVVLSNGERAYAAEQASGFKLDEGYQVKIVYFYKIKYGNGLAFGYEVVFDDDYYLPLENKRDLLNLVKETFVKNGFTVVTDLDNGKMTATMEFSSFTDYYSAQGIDGYVVDEPREPDKRTFLYTYYSSTYQTVFADLKTEGRYVNRIYNACSSAGIEDDKILLCFLYGTPYGEKIITSTATGVRYVSSEKLYYHTFKLTVDDREKEITIYQKVPNTGAWYGLAVAAGVVVLAVPLTIALIKRKKEKNNG